MFSPQRKGVPGEENTAIMVTNVKEAVQVIRETVQQILSSTDPNIATLQQLLNQENNPTSLKDVNTIAICCGKQTFETLLTHARENKDTNPFAITPRHAANMCTLSFLPRALVATLTKLCGEGKVRVIGQTLPLKHPCARYRKQSIPVATSDDPGRPECLGDIECPLSSFPSNLCLHFHLFHICGLSVTLDNEEYDPPGCDDSHIQKLTSTGGSAYIQFFDKTLPALGTEIRPHALNFVKRLTRLNAQNAEKGCKIADKLTTAAAQSITSKSFFHNVTNATKFEEKERRIPQKRGRDN